MLQQWIVAAIVAYAFWVVAKRYLPKSLRRLSRSWTVRIARRLGWKRFAARMEERAEAGASCGSGCGSCGNCGPADKGSEAGKFSISVDALKRTASQQHN